MSIFNGMPSRRKLMRWQHQEKMAQDQSFANNMLAANSRQNINIFPSQGASSQSTLTPYPMSGTPQMPEDMPSNLPAGARPQDDSSYRMGPMAYQSGGSIVDYLKGQGKDSSKAARRAMAIKEGFKGDLSASDNTALLNYLQNKQAAPAQVTPSTGTGSRMTTVQDIDQNTGQAMEMQVPSVRLNVPEQALPAAVTGNVSSPIANRVRPKVSRRHNTVTLNQLPSESSIVERRIPTATTGAFKRPDWMQVSRKGTSGEGYLPNVSVVSDGNYIENYSRTSRKNPKSSGTTDNIDFPALRQIRKSAKEGKGKVRLSDGNLKEFSTLTPSEKSKLYNELDKYKYYNY